MHHILSQIVFSPNSKYASKYRCESHTKKNIMSQYQTIYLRHAIFVLSLLQSVRWSHVARRLLSENRCFDSHQRVNICPTERTLLPPSEIRT